MANVITLSEDEHSRVLKMNADVLNLLATDISLRDGRLDEETKAPLFQRRQDLADRIDMSLASDLAGRVGESALRQAVEDYTPPSARASLEAIIEREGGILPFVQNRIGPMTSSAAINFDDTSFGCALGAVAIVAGVVINQVLGGIAAVIGIVAVAAFCQ